MTQRQLNIRSDEAAETAARLARQLGTTTTDIVVSALRSYEAANARSDQAGWSQEKRRRYDALRAIAAEARKHLIPGSPEDHEWLYDENGLPK